MRREQMMNTALLFRLPDNRGVLEISADVITHFEKNKQRKCFSREAGGQLFAEWDDPLVIRIIKATGPRKTDLRSLFGYVPDRAAEQIEIWENYAQGLHFIGDWHTHAQKNPTPSSMDNLSMREMVQQSSHNQSGFFMIIVGQAEFPEGLHVSFHSKDRSAPLEQFKNDGLQSSV